MIGKEDLDSKHIQTEKIQTELLNKIKGSDWIRDFKNK